MKYRAHIEGFTDHFETVEALKVWALELLARHPDLRGKKVQIWQAKAVSGNWASYNSSPSKICVLGA